MDEPDSELTASSLSRIGGVSVPFASQVINGRKKWPRKLAIAVFRATGRRYGPIADASEADIAVLERFG